MKPDLETQVAKAQAFRAMHHGEKTLVLPNAWDVASARILEEAGAAAIATTSAGVAVTLGYPDGQKISREEMIGAVARIAAEHSLPPQLLHSVIKVESNYNPYAVSSKGALGMMQLIPETARRFGARNPLNPAENIRAGTSYLRWLLAYFEGDLSLALAAYNAGEGAVIRYGGVPPFPETHAYLRKIRTLYPAEYHPFDQLAVR